MYRIKTIPFGQSTLLRLENPDGSDWFQVVTMGATIHSLHLKGSSLIEGAASSTQFLESSGLYEGAKLCPFPGRIPEGKYSFSEVEYQLAQNDEWGPNAIHGLLTQKHFDLVRESCTPEGGSLCLRHTFQPISGYPFPFIIEIELGLSAEGFTARTTIRNTGNTALPMGDGWHPYFSLGGTIDEYVISLPPSKRMILKDLVPTGVQEDHGYLNFKLGDQALDDVFVIEDGLDLAKLTLCRGKKKLSVWQQAGESGYRYLVIYTPGSRDKLAIEPLTCAPNAFNNGVGLTVLDPSGELDLRFGVGLEIDS